MGHKYGLKDIEDEALTRLKLAFPDQLHALGDPHNASLSKRDRKFTCSPARMVLHTHDAIAAINLARTFNISSILPCAFYICSRLPMEILLTGVSNPRGPRSVLSKADLTRCLNGLLELSSRYGLMMQTLWLEVSEEDCEDPEGCREQALDNHFREEHYPNEADALGSCLVRPHCIVPHASDGICQECIGRMENLWADFRFDTWKDLGKIFDLGNKR